MDRAARMLAAAADLTAEEARASLREAARRAGITEVDLAEALFQIHGDPDADS